MKRIPINITKQFREEAKGLKAPLVLTCAKGRKGSRRIREVVKHRQTLSSIQLPPKVKMIASPTLLLNAQDAYWQSAPSSN